MAGLGCGGFPEFLLLHARSLSCSLAKTVNGSEENASPPEMHNNMFQFIKDL